MCSGFRGAQEFGSKGSGFRISGLGFSVEGFGAWGFEPKLGKGGEPNLLNAPPKQKSSFSGVVH